MINGMMKLLLLLVFVMTDADVQIFKLFILIDYDLLL